MKWFADNYKKMIFVLMLLFYNTIVETILFYLDKYASITALISLLLVVKTLM